MVHFFTSCIICKCFIIIFHVKIDLKFFFTYFNFLRIIWSICIVICISHVLIHLPFFPYFDKAEWPVTVSGHMNVHIFDSLLH